MSRVEAGPLVVLAALVGGIFAGERVGAGAAAGAIVVGAGALAAAWFLQHHARIVVAALALALLGVGVMARALDGQRNSPLADAITADDAATFHGVLTSDPDSGRFVASVLARVETIGGHRTVLVAGSGTDATRLRLLQAGDHVTIAGRLSPLRHSSTDDRARWRHAVARLDHAHVVTLASPRGLLAIADGLRNVVLRGTQSLAPTQRALVAGFLLGDTRGLPPDVESAYRDSGLTHLLAVSGENVAFVLALAGPLLRRLSLAARTAVALAIILVFATMTRFEPSVLRASTMAAIALLAALAGRPASRGRVLAFAVIVLLIVDPFLVHSVGFLLSCGASAGIAFAEPPIARRLPGPRIVREPLAVSIAAQLGVLPVLLVAFGTFPLVTPLANLLAAPAAEALGVYGFVASAAAGVAPRLGPLLQQPTAFLVTWVTVVARAGAAVPFRLDRRGTLACVAVVAGVASVACLRARRRIAVPDAAPR
jgi:competence protein ComEC